MQFSTLKLAHRFALLLGVLVCGLVTYGYWSFKTLDEIKVNGALYQRIIQGKDLVADVLPPPEYIIESYLTALELGSAAPAERKALQDKLSALRGEYEQRHQFWRGAALDEETARQLLENVDRPAREFYDRAFTQFLPALERNDVDGAQAALAAMKRSYAAHRAQVNTLVQMVNQRNQADEASARNQISTASGVMFAILVLVSAICLVACLALARNLIRQIGGEPAYVTDIAHRIATGNLAANIELARNDRGSIIYAIKAMRDSLSHIVGQVRTGTDTVATASNEIASGNLDLSSRTEQQASALEEAAAAMEQLATTVRQNSANAHQANQLSRSAAQVAERGGAVVEQVVETMNALNASSRNIVEIIDVIDAIAFQTNILALNAAVEAARAGEQGRGFAVVAAEVRTLAQRSATAARQIKDLITDSVDKIRVGNDLVDQAGTTMREIVHSVHNVTAIMGEIAAAGDEQQAGIGQISQTVSQMDMVTQQNAALVEQAAAASGALLEQARALESAVSVFRLGERAAQAPANTLALAA